jgi:hypothetical protein
MSESETVAMRPLESPRRLSRSSVWDLQRRFYTNAGPEAWRLGITPSEITSSPFIAHAYARVVRAFFRDTRQDERVGRVVELGTGVGRFGWLLATELERQRRAAEGRYQVILTDFARRNLDAAAAHPNLAEATREGLVDFAIFDAEIPAPIRPRGGGVLGPASTDEPLEIIANYIADTLRQDAFAKRGGTLLETRAALVLNDDGPPRLQDPDILHRVVLACSDEPLERPYYADAVLEDLLDGYAREAPDGHILVPIGALTALRYLRSLTTGPVLVLVGDKGYRLLDDIRFAPGPHVTPHGGFSMTVNFHAIGAWAERTGGIALQCPDAGDTFNVAALLFADRPLPQTDDAFRAHVARFGPLDYLDLATDVLGDDTPLAVARELLRLGNYDPWVFRRTAERFIEEGPKLGARQRARLAMELERVARRYFRVQPDDPVLAQVIGALHGIGAFESALRILRRMMELEGENSAFAYNIGACLEGLGRRAEAKAMYERSLRLDPTYEMPKARLGVLAAAGV